MLRLILSAFARSYGRAMGRRAARVTGWLAIPLLIAVGLLGLIELLSGGELSRLALPIVPPTILGPKLLGL